MELLTPYIICPAKMKDVMREYDANERKHAWRAQRDEELHSEEILFGKEYVPEPSEAGFSEKAEAEECEEEWHEGINAAVRESLAALGEEQGRRLKMRFVQTMEYQVIGEAEGISKKNAWKSVRHAEAAFRKEFDKNMKKLRKKIQ